MSPTSVARGLSVARGARGELPQQICHLPTNLKREKVNIFGSLRSLAIISLSFQVSSFLIAITRHEKGYISIKNTRTVVYCIDKYVIY